MATPVGQMLGSFQLRNDKFLVSESAQGAVLAETDTLVIPSASFRVAPQDVSTPEGMVCNEITRGQLFISEDSENNVIWMCLKTIGGYLWKSI